MTFETLQHPIRWLFLFHALFGSLALLAFVIPFLSKKGGKLHRKAGWIYTLAMVIIGTSALIITPWRGFFDPLRNNESKVSALFLTFIACFALSSLWYGIAALKFKNRRTPNRSVFQIGPLLLVIVLGFLNQFVGVFLKEPLLIFFPIVAISTSKKQLNYWLKSPKGKMHWWFAHMSGMSIACIATITAFVVTALPRIWPNILSNSPVIWITPGVLLGFALRYYVKHYENEFGEKAP